MSAALVARGMLSERFGRHLHGVEEQGICWRAQAMMRQQMRGAMQAEE